ncbi:hypothetical protein EMIT0215P_20292 [Pseudomonas serboccidentalis]
MRGASPSLWVAQPVSKLPSSSTGKTDLEKTVIVKAPVSPAHTGYTGVKTRIRDCTSRGCERG